MITKILEWVLVAVFLGIIITIMPSVSDFPLPEWLTDNLSQMFLWIKLLLIFPVLDTCFYLVGLFFLYIWIPLQAYNLVLKILSLFPAFEHLAKFKIK